VNRVPVILFTYARPAHLARVLGCLRENRVPLIYAFSDGPKNQSDANAVLQTRLLLQSVDWTDMHITERTKNLGLGQNVLTGVTEVAASNEAFIVWEDDLIAVPGTYAWLCSALEHYAPDSRVFSVSAWTHPAIIPKDAGDRPYFDARAECWVWGAWARAWTGMDAGTAIDRLEAAEKRGLPAGAYGADLPAMAEVEQVKNIFAFVRPGAWWSTLDLTTRRQMQVGRPIGRIHHCDRRPQSLTLGRR
jgi:hypothetical protein